MKKILTYRSTLYACYLGYITQAIVVNLAPLFFVIFQSNFGISYTDIANLVLLVFVIQIVVDSIMVKYIGKMGYRLTATIAHIFATIGLVCLWILPTVMPPYAGILVSVSQYSIGGGLIEVVISPIVDALPGDAKASAMSILHAFYSWGQMLVVILTTLLLTVFGDQNWRWIPLVWASIPFFNIIFFQKVPLIEITEEQKMSGIAKFFRSPIFMIALCMMICGGASELSMAQWASLFAEQALGVPKVMGDLLGPCLFALCMGIGRTVYGVLGDAKLRIESALCWCAGLTIACYLVAILVPNPVVSLLGCAVCGFGVSLMWPGVLSYTSQKYAYKAGPVLFTLLALGGDVGCSLGPWITGIVCDLSLTANPSLTEGQGIRYGLLAAVFFPAAMILLVTAMRRQKKTDI